MNKIVVYSFLILFNLTRLNVVIGQTDSSDALNEGRLDESLMLEIDELIVDDTQTKIGNDFFDMFYQRWDVPESIENYTITISEKPLPRLGTLVSITINEIQVFQQFVQPRYDVMEEKVQQALYTSLQYLINYEEIQKSLQGEDLSGTGIY